MAPKSFSESKGECTAPGRRQNALALGGARAVPGLCCIPSARAGEETTAAGSCVKPGTGHRGWDKTV